MEKKVKKLFRKIIIFIVVLFLIFSENIVFIQAADQEHLRIDSFTSNDTFTVPSGVTSVLFEAWGGGGGGETNVGGGGGGSYMKITQSVTAGQNYDIVVGAGGSGGVGSVNGASSTVSLSGGSTILIAPGGESGAEGGRGGLAANGTGDSGFNGGNANVGTGNQIGGGGAGDQNSGSANEGGNYFGGYSTTGNANRELPYASGGGSSASSGRTGEAGIVRATYTIDVGAGYPVIKTRNWGRSSTNSTSHPINLPSGVEAGDLLITLFSIDCQTVLDGCPALSGYTGWNLLIATSSATGGTGADTILGAVFYKIATGSDSLTITTDNSEMNTHFTLRIANGDIPTASDAIQNGGFPDSPSHDSGSSGKYLWIAAGMADLNAETDTTAPPTNYSDLLYLSGGHINSSTAITMATRHYETQTEDPGAFSYGGNEQWAMFTISVPYSATGDTYSIPWDSLNSAGLRSTSPSYILESTVGEVATGDSSSSNYSIRAGYQQLDASDVSVSAISDVVMAPDIASITGGTSNGGTQFVVTTTNYAGYTVTINSDSNNGMEGETTSSYIPHLNEFSPYVPDYEFSSAPVNSAAFAYTINASSTGEIVQAFRNNGATDCDIGSTETVDKCWISATTSSRTIINRTSASPSGATSTISYRVVVSANPDPIIPEGVYTSTTTLTILAL